VIKPATVPQKAKQAGEIHSRWEWVEPVVWTERMLTALERWVKGGKWFSLIDKVYAMANLQRAEVHLSLVSAQEVNNCCEAVSLSPYSKSRKFAADVLKKAASFFA
jgi:hypothetical protein